MRISNILLKIATPIIITGIFIITIFIALNYEKLDMNFYIVFTLVTIYIFFFGFATGQRFTMPVKKLLKRATDLSEGDLTARIYLENKDEFGDLAKVFNKIADELEESRSQTEATEKSVGIKVKAKTQALEETINALEQKVKNRTLELQKMIDESNKIQEKTKNKEVEAEQLKKELSRLKESLNKNQAVKKVLGKKNNRSPSQQ
ncbi:MAG: HAMP domain-containing protein [Candidatus Staskawiczbacteria bacterium]|nr:HAMP domain-containing protein [Candidatus Staskawiczbacteria bacterium]